jgi:hypothetical protein
LWWWKSSPGAERDKVEPQWMHIKEPTVVVADAGFESDVNRLQ